ncbi:MAG: (d)CMP kinase [Chloroflexota bacterium]
MTTSAALTVAIDGPGSSGKSSVGAAVAAELGYRFCDTGLLYRAITWLALARGIPETDAAGLIGLIEEIELKPDAQQRLVRVAVGGRDVTDEVRGPDVDARVSVFARVPEVRSALLVEQRRIAAGAGIVMAGRDIGTVVLPDADVKIYLDASVEERARRRTGERGLRGDADPDGAGAAKILAQLRRRDDLDRGRAVAPLRPADDAVVITTDGNTLGQTVALVVAAIRSAGARPGAVASAAAPPAGSRRAGR